MNNHKTPSSNRIGLLLAVAILVPTHLAGQGEGNLSGRDEQPAAMIQPAERSRVVEGYGKLPLHFEPNRGQADPEVRFLARGGGMTIFLTATEAVLALRGKTEDPKGSVVRMKMIGGQEARAAKALDILPGISNYFLKNDPGKWVTRVPQYRRVALREVYPGIDVVFYGNQRRLEYDFVVGPGADAAKIELAFEGVDSLRESEAGDLLLSTASGELTLRKPSVYQEEDGQRVEVAARYRLEGERIEFALASYDPSRPLVIDPVLEYATYLGGTGWDEGLGIAVDASGAAFVTGATDAFPTTVGAYEFEPQGGRDAYVAKLSPAGDGLVYSSYLGGTAEDVGWSIAVDGDGAAYVTGWTYSHNFPTQGEHQAHQGGWDAFVTKLSPAGDDLVYSTYLGGDSEDHAHGIAVDTSAAAYVTGWTESDDFPTTDGAYQDSLNGTQDAFVTKLSPDGHDLVYSTYLGGDSADYAFGIAVGASGAVYVTGDTSSGNFPTTNGAHQDSRNGTEDAFVTKLNPAGDTLDYSTYLGGNNRDLGWGIAVDTSGAAYVTGWTNSTAELHTPGAYQPSKKGNEDAFVSKLSPSGNTLIYSTYLGWDDDGSCAADLDADCDMGRSIAVDASGAAYVTGKGQKLDDKGAFVAKLKPAGNELVYLFELGGEWTGGRP